MQVIDRFSSVTSLAPLHKRGGRTCADPVALSITAAVSVTALFGVVGADSRWAAALGRAILHRGGIPSGVPFAAVPTSGWHNVPVLGELAFAGLATAAGDRGLLVAQIAAVTIALSGLAAAMRRVDATGAGAASALLVVAAGAFPALAIARLQLFSLALYPLLLLLLHREAEQPSRRIWLLPPLVALWSNLHGAVLVGVAVAGVYLVFCRLPREPRTAVGALVASLVALCATPALLATPAYYVGVAGSEAAREGVGLWRPLSPSVPLDVVSLACAAVLLGLALRRKLRLWEGLCMLALALLTLHTSRSGVWLLMTAAVPAARALPVHGRLRLRTSAVLVSVFLCVAALALARGPIPAGASPGLVQRALVAAAGTPILAQDVLAEQVALAGGTVWAGNPLDAFPRARQRLYLAWTLGRPGGDRALTEGVRAVLVHPGSAAERHLERRGDFRRAGSDSHAVLYVASGAP